jgi:signal transduction histidine kinase
MRQLKLIQTFRWSIFAAVFLLSAQTVIGYWQKNAWPIVAFNLILPVLLYFFLRTHTVNRIGYFLLASPVCFILEVTYLLHAKISLAFLTATNLVAIVFSINLTLFAVFGDHFTGQLKKHLDSIVYPLLAANLAAYGLLYLMHPFNITPYIFMICLLAFYFIVMVRHIRSRESMIAEQKKTILNSRVMMRGQIHDISNFLGSISGWIGLAGRINLEDKRLYYIGKAKASFEHIKEHLHTVVAMLDDEHYMVRLSLMTATRFIEHVADFLKDSFVGETRVIKEPAPEELIPGTLLFVRPAILSPKHLYVDLSAFCSAIVNLISNAGKAGATGMMVVIEESSAPPGLTISIRDNGPGIPAAKAALLFKEKVESATGSGVGLLGVRMIIESHDAEIKLTNPNTAGVGYTEFTISGLKYAS